MDILKDESKFDDEEKLSIEYCLAILLNEFKK